MTKFRLFGRQTDEVSERELSHRQLAREVAAEGMVLLKNEGILPLKPEGKKIAFIGKFAEQPRFQGGGSSHINSFKITSALDAVKEVTEVTYAQGYDIKEDKTDEKLHKEAVQAAKEADVRSRSGLSPAVTRS
mgnify:CR=1 FL=1